MPPRNGLPAASPGTTVDLALFPPGWNPSEPAEHLRT